MDRKPEWFKQVIEDTRKKTDGRPAWRRSSEVNAELQRLAGSSTGDQANVPEVSDPGTQTPPVED